MQHRPDYILLENVVGFDVRCFSCHQKIKCWARRDLGAAGRRVFVDFVLSECECVRQGVHGCGGGCVLRGRGNVFVRSLL